MKIHHLINRLSDTDGGAERIARQLHDGLLQRGFESHLITLACGETTEPNPRWHSLNSKRVYSIAALRSVRKYLKQHCSNQDVVHTHLFPTNFYVGLAANSVRWKGRLVTTEHSTHNRRREMRGGRWLDRELYRRYDRIFCISQGTRDQLVTWQPQLQDRLTIIPNGIELKHQQFTARPARSPLTVVSIGRLSAIKNYPVALNALARIHDIPWRYLIAGDGDQRPLLQAMIAELKLDSRCQLLGHVADTTTLLANADLYLHTAKWEGFGLAIGEGMNAGLPVIASDVPGVRDLVRGEQDGGILIDSSDELAIESALRRLFNDHAYRRNLGQKGYQRSLEFSAEAMLAGYADYYSSCSR